EAALEGHRAELAAMRDQESRVGPAVTRPAIGIAGGELRRQRAHGDAADRDRAAEGLPRPAHQYGTLECLADENIDGAERRGGEEHLAAIAPRGPPSPMPGRDQLDDAEATIDQRPL